MDNKKNNCIFAPVVSGSGFEMDGYFVWCGSVIEDGGRCFRIAANMDFLLVCTYEENGENPELVIYKKR